MKPIISISTVAFDGYPLEVALEHIAGLKATHVEIAFIKGYMDPFKEDVFTLGRAQSLYRAMDQKGLSCYAFSSHLDLSAEGVADIFFRRMDFAAELGAGIILTNAAPQDRKEQFLNNIEVIARRADEVGLRIGLENPGEGLPNLLQDGKTAVRLVREIEDELGIDNIGLNYDFGNTVSYHNGQLDPAQDHRATLGKVMHLHIKDVFRDSDGWQHSEIGRGMIDYKSILANPAVRKLPLSLEIPLRIIRPPDGPARRLPQPVALDEITRVLRGSLTFVRSCLTA